jgi:hypothetical protein
LRGTALHLAIGSSLHLPSSSLNDSAHPMVASLLWRFSSEKGRTPLNGRLRLADLQTDLDGWLRKYNEERVHQGRWCYGRTPMQTFVDTIPLAKEKVLAAWTIGQSDQPDNEEQRHIFSDQVFELLKNLFLLRSLRVIEARRTSLRR